MKTINNFFKRAVSILFTTAFLMACQSATHDDANAAAAQATESATHAEHAATELALNNGAKWKADSSTNSNVASLRAIEDAAKPVTLQDFQQVGQALQTGIGKMVNECKMKGADHDALHLWLEPLMEQNKKLLMVTSAKEGKEWFEKMQKQMGLYANYFE